MRLHLLLPLLSIATLALSQSACPATPNPLPKPNTFTSTSTLPDPFIYLSGVRVKTKEEWYDCRQPEILHLLQEYQYGYYPDHAAETVAGSRSGNTIRTTVTAAGKSGTVSATIALPNGATAANPAPVVIAIGGINNTPYLQNGVAVVTLDYTGVAPDSNGKSGAFWDLYNGRDIGVLTAWAWGVHRALDGLTLAVPEIDVTRVGVTGCSRLGKAALAAGLFDKRITLTMPMSAGIQGTGPYRYWQLSGQGENLENSKSGAGWWTNSVLGGFVNNHEKLPFDAHTIAAAIAPRAVVMDQGSGDPYVNSKGTATVTYPAAKLVYDWLGVGDKIGVAIRNGGHCDFAGDDNVLPFVLKTFKGTATSRDYNNLSPWTANTAAYPWANQSPPRA